MNVIKAEEQSIWSPVAAVEAPPFHWLPYLIAFLRRRWPLMALCMLGAVALSLSYALTATPKFTAGAELMVDIRRVDLLSQQHETQDSQTLSSVLESQVEILGSEGLARKVVERLKLLDDKLFNTDGFSLVGWVRWQLARLVPAAFNGGSAGDREGAAAQRLMSMTSVRRVGLTYVIEIGVTTPSAVESARLANGLVDAYIADQLEVQDDTTRQAGMWLQTRLRELRDQALQAGMAVEQYKAAKNIIGTDKGLMNEQQLAELNSELVSARAKTSEAKARLDRIQTVLQGDLVHQGVNDDLQSPIINDLRTKYLDDAEREAEWSARYGATNAQVVKLRIEMQQIENSIRSELQRIAASHESDYEVAHADEIAVTGRLRALINLTIKTNGDRVELASLQSSADTYRSVYENFLTRYMQAMQDESFPISEARVVTAATPPLKKSAPKTTILVALSAVLGAGIGFMASFFIETMDRTLRTRGQLRAVTGLTCLGQLPRLQARRRPGRGSSRTPGENRVLVVRQRSLRVTVDNPESGFAQALRTLKMRLARDDARSRDIRMIGFVSSGHGEGVSTVATNFAQCLARSGSRTILLDWDFEGDTLSRALTSSHPEGFGDALAGKRELRDLIWCDPDTGLRFLPAGMAGALPPSLLCSSKAKALLSALQSEHDYIVVDLPPMSPSVEAHGLGNLLDAFVLVVGWGRTGADRVIDSLTHTGLDDSKFVGAVFNRVNFRVLRKYPSGISEKAAAWA
jgi:polysaccharide biosynthesis transport protein